MTEYEALESVPPPKQLQAGKNKNKNLLETTISELCGV